MAEPVGLQDEIEKSIVHPSANPNLDPEFEEGDEVKITDDDDGVLRALAMIVAKLGFDGRGWQYQLKRSGQTTLYKGGAWFKESDIVRRF